MMGTVSGGLVTDERTRTSTEEIVARIWAAELRLPHVGLDEDFIDLGSHSLQSVAVVARLEERFGVSIPVRVLFEEPTVADLAAWIDHRGGETHGAEIEFILVQGCGTPEFLFITLIVAIDVIAGYSISVRLARRDLALGAD